MSEKLFTDMSPSARIPTKLTVSGIRKRIADFYLIPDGPFLKNWNRFMVLMTLFSHVLVTFIAAFRLRTTITTFLDYSTDILFLMDIYFKLHTAFLKNGFWVIFPREMKRRYVQSVEFKFDIISNFPFEIFSLVAYGAQVDIIQLWSYLRLTKMLRLVRLFIYFYSEESKLHANVALQVVKFVVYYIIVIHTTTCAWFKIACPEGIGLCRSFSWMGLVGRDGSPGTAVSSSGDILDYTLPVTTMYSLSFYWTVFTMTSTGYGDIHGTTNVERIFAALTMSVGPFFFSYIAGTIASMLANMDARRVAYKQKMEAVKQYMNIRDMKKDMKKRVLNYYQYVWERSRGIEVEALFEDMPIAFRNELALSINLKLLEKVGIFGNCSVGFIRQIAKSMKLCLFTANEYVVRRGDLGLEMYFLARGRIDLYLEDENKKSCETLHEGSYFGEYPAILGKEYHFSALAICNTDLFVLTRMDLKSAFQVYPEDREKVIRLMLKKPL